MTKILFDRFARIVVLVLFGTAVSSQAVWAQAGVSAPKITIYGTGRIGSRIADEALSRGHIVTVVVRKPEEVTKTDRNLTVIKGDLLDTASVTKQIAGQDVVIVAINGREVAAFVDSGKSIIAAARRIGAKAPRIIWVGGASSLKDDSGKMLFEVNPIPDAPAAAAPGHIQVLTFFKTVSGVQWTFFSPAVSTAPGQRTGKFRLGGDHVVYDANGKSVISMEDFAIAAVDEAEKPQHIHAQFTVGY
jgi:putative NADH-flavin reductase